MRKFLSLVLALVMMMSLVTINAGAKEFTDDSDITYQEAVDVISTIKVVDGYDNGSYGPKGNLTRGAAAKIICNLILGPTTASELHADTAPFRDVPVTHDFAGYIAYCQKEGIISGYADGSFRPAGTLTGYAFMKMLLGALGYDAEIEGFVGPNWSINVAKKAIGIGLNRSLEGDFNGVNYITREEAALYAFNTLRTDLVEYDQKITATVNGAEVTVGNSLAKAQTWNNSMTRHNNIRDDQYIQFAEQYFNKLVLTEAEDVFGRPDREWKYDGDEIGAYINYDLFKQEYTTKVTGKELYNLLGSSVVDVNDGYKFTITVDGETAPEYLKEGDNAYFTQGNLVRTNTEGVGATDKGVLTQVFVDNDKDVERVWIAIINTYVAKATADYNTKKEEAKFDVYGVDDLKSGSDIVLVKNTAEEKTDVPYIETLTVSNEDINVENVKEDDLFLVHVAEGEIKEMLDPEILSEKTISNFKLDSYVTSEGTQYDHADTALYDPEVLDEYDVSNMKNLTYNIILDEYGYLIGLELNEDPDQYVFITGMDGNYSNLNNRNADMAAIFLDGTMDVITVDLKNSDAGIKSFLDDGAIVNTWCKYTTDKNGVYTLKYIGNAIDTDNGIKIAQFAQNSKETMNNGSNGTVDNKYTIDKGHVNLIGSNGTGAFSRVYGNDDTVYINVTLDVIDKSNTDFDATATTALTGGNGLGKGSSVGGETALTGAADTENYVTTATSSTLSRVAIIDDVDSVTVGVKNANIEVNDVTNATIASDLSVDATPMVYPRNEIYTLYNKDGYVIAAVTIGEDSGSTSKYAYFTSNNVNREAYSSDDDEWTWSREAVVDGEIVTLTEVGAHLKWLATNNVARGHWAEVRYDANGNVRKVIDKTGDFAAADGNADDNGEFFSEVVDFELSAENEKSNIMWVDLTTYATKNYLHYKAGTLYTETNDTKGFAVSPSVKTVVSLSKLKKGGTPGVLADVNQFDSVTDGYEGYSGLEEAIRDLDKNFCGYLSAVVEDGVATVIILADTWGEPVNTGNSDIGGSNSKTFAASNRSGEEVTGAVNVTDDSMDASAATVRFTNGRQLSVAIFVGKDYDTTSINSEFYVNGSRQPAGTTVDVDSEGYLWITTSSLDLVDGDEVEIRLSDLDLTSSGAISGGSSVGGDVTQPTTDAEIPDDDSAVKEKDSGAYVFTEGDTNGDALKADIGDVNGQLEENMFFVFKTTGANRSATLTIKNASGTTVYTENGGPYVAEGGHYFYVQVIGTGLNNYGSGVMKNSPLPAGEYTWSVTGTGVSAGSSGSFTIA